LESCAEEGFAAPNGAASFTASLCDPLQHLSAPLRLKMTRRSELLPPPFCTRFKKPGMTAIGIRDFPE
jgi:hypothetical protein